MKEKKKIWSIYTRLFHVMLITSVVTSYILIQKENQLTSHVLVGYLVALLIAFRIIWGFLGVKCSQHKDLLKKAPQVPAYFKNYFNKNRGSYMGHNPASAVYVLLIMTLLILVTVSGSLLYGIQENSGIFASLNKNYSGWMLLLESIHKTATTVLIVFIASHVIGVLLNLVFNGSDLILGMIHGKRIETSFDVILTPKQHLFGLVWIASVLSLGVYFYTKPDNILTQDQSLAIDFRSDSYETSSGCGSCHIVYPAYLLPKKSWNFMMDNLENHFGKDASRPEEEAQSIREYLLSHAAEYSTREASIKVLDRLGDKIPQAITETNYWKEKHKNITKEQFAADYGIKSDCTTCHKTIRDGLIQDAQIKFNYE
ncbi:MAG: cytochrome b/b6 domain-containing protein [Sulfurimonas sp.]|nr:cytochrome b/b6 domain-containing protein [Sulfurimonas sp.]MDQ7060602.1 cytochrome b/b6 domain-containing protein [Sulfurimonas sp.]